MKSRNLRRRCAVLAVLMMFSLCGCIADSAPGGSDDASTGTPASSTAITVYSGEAYRSALQQIFSHISMQNADISVSWTSSRETADVVITDRLDPSEWEQYRVLPMEELSVEPISELVVQQERGVIGLPLFLRVETYWYDELLYSRSKTEVPCSLDSWRGSSLVQTCPAVCDASDMTALFWSTVAPLYLSAGGTEEELSSGALRAEPLEAALEQLQQMRDQGLLVLSQNAADIFTETQAMFWVTGVGSVAEVYTRMSNLSEMNCMPTSIYPGTAGGILVVRADVVAVRESADRAAADKFLKLLFTQSILNNLSSDANVPMACRMDYAVVPTLPETCYTAMASPLLQLAYVTNCWNAQHQTAMETALLALMNGQLDGSQAAEQIMKGA